MSKSATLLITGIGGMQLDNSTMNIVIFFIQILYHGAPESVIQTQIATLLTPPAHFLDMFDKHELIIFGQSLRMDPLVAPLILASPLPPITY